MPVDIHRGDVRRLMAKSAQLIEVLPAEEYNDAHLPSAINIPLKKLDKKSVTQIDPAHPIIV